MPRKPTFAFLLAHPAHFFALGCGSGLAPKAPGTFGTLFAWASYVLIRPNFSDVGFAVFLLVCFVMGVVACDRTGRSLDDLAGRLEALIVTRGAEGSHIYAGGRRIDIPCAPAPAVVDPTGCGDAYRSGLLYGIANGWDWEKTGRQATDSSP